MTTPTVTRRAVLARTRATLARLGVATWLDLVLVLAATIAYATGHHAISTVLCILAISTTLAPMLVTTVRDMRARRARKARA